MCRTVLHINFAESDRDAAQRDRLVAVDREKAIAVDREKEVSTNESRF